jgi:hypothetical protein
MAELLQDAQGALRGIDSGWMFTSVFGGPVDEIPAEETALEVPTAGVPT